MKDVAFEVLVEDLIAYKRKYYLNRLLRGSIFFLALAFTLLLLVNSLEYSLKFSVVIRTILFFFVSSYSRNGGFLTTGRSGC